jgi:hypothetical protein
MKLKTLLRQIIREVKNRPIKEADEVESADLYAKLKRNEWISNPSGKDEFWYPFDVNGETFAFALVSSVIWRRNGDWKYVFCIKKLEATKFSDGTTGLALDPSYSSNTSESVSSSIKSIYVNAIMKAKQKYGLGEILIECILTGGKTPFSSADKVALDAATEVANRTNSVLSLWADYSMLRISDGPIVPFITKIGRTKYTITGDPENSKDIKALAKFISTFDRSPVDNTTPWERYIAAVKAGDMEEIEWNYDSIFKTEGIYEPLDDFELIVKDPQGNAIYGENYADKYKI